MQASRQEVVEAVRQADDTILGARQMGAAQAGVAGRISASAQLAELQRRHEMRHVGADATTPFLKAAWACRHVVRGHMAWTADAPARPPLLLSVHADPLRTARRTPRQGQAGGVRQPALGRRHPLSGVGKSVSGGFFGSIQYEGIYILLVTGPHRVFRPDDAGRQTRRTFDLHPWTQRSAWKNHRIHRPP